MGVSGLARFLTECHTSERYIVADSGLWNEHMRRDSAKANGPDSGSGATAQIHTKTGHAITITILPNSDVISDSPFCRVLSLNQVFLQFTFEKCWTMYDSSSLHSLRPHIGFWANSIVLDKHAASGQIQKEHHICTTPSSSA